VNSITISNDGTIYVGGFFLNAGGNPANRIASWDGSTWNALGTGFDAQCRVVFASKNGDIYAGGAFSTAGGVTTSRMAIWDGSSWAGVGTDINQLVYTFAEADNGDIYVGGQFTTPGNCVVRWNGNSFSTLAGGLTGGTAHICHSLLYDNGILYAAGDFDTADGVSVPKNMAAWNGSLWYTLGLKSGSASGQSSRKVFIDFNGNLYIGVQGGGATDYAALNTIAYIGTYNTYPIINIKRTGGTSARLYTIRNETTGALLSFGYNLQDGEKLTIDTRPASKSITSSINGNSQNALSPASNFGEFYLLPGNSGNLNNVISAFVDNNGATITATIEWRDTFISED
jgi:hypothetical protein